MPAVLSIPRDLLSLLGYLKDAGLSARIASPGKDQAKMVIVGDRGITVSEAGRFVVEDAAGSQEIRGFDALVALLKTAR